MPTRRVPGTELDYVLVSYDANGREREDGSAGKSPASTEVQARIASEPITDIFLMCHGWKGDIPAAITQYESWISAMAACAADRERIRQASPGFRALLVGVHWPSLPWGEEDLSAPGVAFGAPDAESITDLVEDAASKVADTRLAREALAVVFESAGNDPAPAELPASVRDAYRALAQEAELVGTGPAGQPGDDAEAFDPEIAYRLARDGEESSGIAFGGGRSLGLLSVLRQLSFWTMKRRGRICGQGGVSDLVELILSSSAERRPKVHLMGHSFGCIVMSAAIAGRPGRRPPRPVSTLYLVQGALSLWSFSSAIPVAGGRQGCFNSVVREGRIQGAVVTTQSAHDSAVGCLYPVAAGMRQQVDFAPGELPKYGAIGAYGIRGPGVAPIDLDMKPVAATYEFRPGGVYNLDATEFICRGGGLSGAHSDIAGPEVAHAFWEAVLAAPTP